MMPTEFGYAEMLIEMNNGYPRERLNTDTAQESHFFQQIHAKTESSCLSSSTMPSAQNIALPKPVHKIKDYLGHKDLHDDNFAKKYVHVSLV
jgi:hypothetical protein